MNKDVQKDDALNKNIKTRALSAFEIVSESIKLGSAQMKYIFPICLAVFIPFNILLLFWPPDFGQRLWDFEFIFNDPGAGYYLVYVWLMLGLNVIFTALAAAAVSYVTVQTIEQKPVLLSEMLDASLMRWGKLIYTSALYYLLTMIFVPLIFPVFYFGIVFMLYPCIAAISSKYGFSALIISRVLMKGKFIKGLFVFLLNLCVVLAMHTLLDAVFDLFAFPNHPVTRFIYAVLGNCFEAFSYIAVCLFYINAHYNFSGKELSQ
jgi:hypothetical protein